jgi:hypothetical protein
VPIDHFFDAAILVAIGFTLIIQSTLGKIMAGQQQAVDAVVAQLVKSREEIPAELQALYVEREGAFVLDAEGVVEKARVEELRAKVRALVDQKIHFWSQKRYQNCYQKTVAVLRPIA